MKGGCRQSWALSRRVWRAQHHTPSLFPSSSYLLTHTTTPHNPQPQLILLAGSTVGGKALRRGVAAAQREQAELCAAADLDRGSAGSARRRAARTPKVAVDAVFFARLRGILKM